MLLAMSEQRFISGDRAQGYLLPPDMREWLPADHLVWLVVEAIERVDTGELARAYRPDGQGRTPYDPTQMATLLVYAYAVGERSSRGIERRCAEDVAFRVAACGLQPDHVTIARFRRRHQDALIGLFAKVLGLCAAAGLVRLGLVAIDGTRIRADANKDRLRPVAEALLAEAERTDADEDALPAEQQMALRGRAGGSARQRTALRDAAAALEEQPAPERTGEDGRQEPAAPTQASRPGRRERGRALAERRRTSVNATDPESRMIRGPGGGFMQGYNAQVAVAESYVVVGCGVCADNGDNRQLAPMVATTEQALHEAGVRRDVGWYLADAGYWSGPAVAELQADGARILCPPNGRPRTRGLPPSAPVGAMEERLARPSARARYRRRQAIVEPVIGTLKVARRFERLLLRGLRGAQLEWTLACIGHNLRRLHAAA
jgi:transposase